MHGAIAELGYRAQLGNRLSLSATAFHYQWDKLRSGQDAEFGFELDFGYSPNFFDLDDDDDSFEPGARVEVMEIKGATALVARTGVDPARITSRGFGKTQPVATNETPEGRQQNRRVELVKR